MEGITSPLYIFLFVSILPATVHYVQGDSYYVIVQDGFCPSDVDEDLAFNQSSSSPQCLTLQEYVANYSANLTVSENVILELEPGNHILESTLYILNVSSITVTTSGNGTVSILCQGTKTAMRFDTVENVYINGVNFMNCTASTVFKTVDTFRLDGSNGSFHLQNVQNITISDSTFSGANTFETVDTFRLDGSSLINGSFHLQNITNAMISDTTFLGASIFETVDMFRLDGSSLISGSFHLQNIPNLTISNATFSGASIFETVDTFRLDGSSLVSGSFHLQNIPNLTISNTTFSGTVGTFRLDGSSLNNGSFHLQNVMNATISDSIFSGASIFEMVDTFRLDGSSLISGSFHLQNITNAMISGTTFSGASTFETVDTFRLDDSSLVSGSFHLQNIPNLTISNTTFSGTVGTFRLDGSSLVNGSFHLQNVMNATISDSIFSGASIFEMVDTFRLDGFSLDNGSFHLQNVMNATISDSIFLGASIFEMVDTFRLDGSSLISGSFHLRNMLNATISDSTFSGASIFETVDTFRLDGSSLDNGSFHLQNVMNATISDTKFSGADKRCCYNGSLYVIETSLLVQKCGFYNNSGFEAGAILAIDSNITVERSTFQNNSADGGYREWNGSPGNSGGAISARVRDVSSTALLTVTNSNFSANRVIGSGGGAIHVINYGSTKLVACHFVNNCARLNGGAVLMGGDSPSAVLWIKNSTFLNNTAQWNGGALHVSGSMTSTSFMIEQSIFYNNSGNSPYPQGGAVYFYITGEQSDIRISQCDFNNNKAISGPMFAGGALYIYIRTVIPNTLSIEQSTFVNNGASNGGAIWMSVRGTVSITETSFASNVGDVLVIGVGTNRMWMSNCSFISNMDRGLCLTGGNISIYQTDFFNNTGGALSCTNTITDITGCTFSYNSKSATQCGVVELTSGTNQVTISNSTFTYNRARVTCSPATPASMLVMNSIFSHNTAVGSGGVFMVSSSSASLTVWDSKFDNNTASVDGGVISSGYGDRLILNVVFNRCSYTSNQAGNKGGVIDLSYKGNARFNECVFSHNHANAGGVVHTDDSTFEADNVIFENNTANVGRTIRACKSIVIVPDDLYYIYRDSIDQDNYCTLYSEVPETNTSIPYVQNFDLQIKASSQSPCSNTASGEPCITLQQYLQDGRVYASAYNLTLELQPGHYNLSTELSFKYKNLLVLRSMNATIQCIGSLTKIRANAIRSAHVSGITFVDCEFYVKFVSEFSLEDSKFHSQSALDIQAATNATIQNSSFQDSPVCCLSRNLEIYKSGSVLIRLCTFSNSGRGSIDGVRTHMITIEYTNFTASSIILSGAGVGVRIKNDIRNGTLVIADSNFIANSAPTGGAVYVSGKSNVWISRSNFISNRVTGYNGGGGALNFHGINSVSISESTFVDNEAYSGPGGAVACTAKTLTIDRCNFVNNLADRHFVQSQPSTGGALYAGIQDSVFISQSKFKSNSARDSGGAVHLYHSTNQVRSVWIDQSNFTNNTAYISGGALYLSTESDCSVQINQSRFVCNNITRIFDYQGRTYGDNGSAVYIQVAAESFVEIQQSEFFDNTEGIYYDQYIVPVYIGGTDNVTLIDTNAYVLPTTTSILTPTTTSIITPTTTSVLNPTTTSVLTPTTTSIITPTTTNIITEATTISSIPTELTTTHGHLVETTIIEPSTTPVPQTEITGTPKATETDATTIPAISTSASSAIETVPTANSPTTKAGTTIRHTSATSTTSATELSAGQERNTLVIALPTVIGILIILVICVSALLLTAYLCGYLRFKTNRNSQDEFYTSLSGKEETFVELLNSEEVQDNLNEPDEAVEKANVAKL